MASHLDASKLQAFENAAAGHDGVLLDPSGELVIKPCTPKEISFYEQTVANRPDFAELLPTYMGTLQLGASEQAKELAPDDEVVKEGRLHGAKLATGTAIVLENLEHPFKRANVLDLKLGARLYADGTAPEKAARLDKVASETTTGSLNFRIAGMKVWNGSSYDVYDKFYGRKFSADSVRDGFTTFFTSLTSSLDPSEAAIALETILADITKARQLLQRSESRMYGASILLVYEGDGAALKAILNGTQKTPAPKADEKAPTPSELNEVENDEDDDSEDEAAPIGFLVKMIDFAHAEWTPGQGVDENVVQGLKNIEMQIERLVDRVAGV